MTTNDELEKLVKLAEKATPGPWRTWEIGGWTIEVRKEIGIANNEAVDLGFSEKADDICTITDELNTNMTADAAYIAAACNALPGIIAELKAAREALQAASTLLDALSVELEIGEIMSKRERAIYKDVQDKVNAALRKE